jgi:integrase
MFAPDFMLRTSLPRKVKQLKRELPTSAAVMQVVSGSDIELPVLLAMCMCLRISEVRGIKKDDVHGNELWIQRIIVTADGKHIEKEIPKTDATRRIESLPPFLREMILAQPTDHATELTGQALYKRFTRMMAKAGYEGIRFHDLRHISASDMRAQGITDRVAAERGGWSGTQTMRQVYQHSFSDDRKNADQTMNSYYENLHNATQNATRENENDADS